MLRGISGTIPPLPASVQALASVGEGVVGSLSGSFDSLQTLFLVSSDPTVAAMSGSLPDMLGENRVMKSMVLLNQVT